MADANIDVSSDYCLQMLNARQCKLLKVQIIMRLLNWSNVTGSDKSSYSRLDVSKRSY